MTTLEPHKGLVLHLFVVHPSALISLTNLHHVLICALSFLV